MTFEAGMIFAAAFTGLTVYAALTDIADLKIANWIPVALIALFALYAVGGYTGLGLKPVPLHWHLGIALMVLAVGFCVFALKVMGAGDIKLMTAVALWAGPSKIVPFIFYTSLVGAALGVVILAGSIHLKRVGSGAPSNMISRLLPSWVRRGVIPYGVAICVGALSTVPSLLL